MLTIFSVGETHGLNLPGRFLFASTDISTSSVKTRNKPFFCCKLDLQRKNNRSHVLTKLMS